VWLYYKGDRSIDLLSLIEILRSMKYLLPGTSWSKLWYIVYFFGHPFVASSVVVACNTFAPPHRRPLETNVTRMWSTSCVYACKCSQRVRIKKKTERSMVLSPILDRDCCPHAKLYKKYWCRGGATLHFR